MSILALLFTGLYIALNNSYVQNLIKKHLIDSLEKKTGSKVQIGEINFSLFTKLSLNDVFISDTHNDTLLFVKQLDANVSGINLISNNFRLSNLELNEPYLKIISYKDSTMNLFTFIDALSAEEVQDSTKNTDSHFFSTNNATIKNGRFVYLDSERKSIPFGMNYDDLDFFNINAAFSQIRTIGDAIKISIDTLECEEKSGFKVLSAKALMTIDNGLLRFDDAHIALPKSELNAKYLNFSYESGTGAWSNFTNAVIQDYWVKSSKINLDEIAIFNDNLLGYDHTLSASGHLTGTVKNMRAENVLVKFFEHTAFRGELSMNGLPNLEETFFDANIKHFQTTLNELEKIKIPNLEAQYLSFPEKIKKLGVFSYKGKYTGFISDFVFYGQFFSDFGNVKTDISVKPTTKTKQLEVSGKIITDDFQIGELIDNKIFGKISLNVDVVNAMANENYNSFAKIKGTVNKIELKNYTYENINLDGYLADKVFDGTVSVNSKNIAFDFKGNLDFHEEIPKTNFTLHLKNAQLSPLNLNPVTEDKLSAISFKLQSNLNGGSIDDATGKITITDLKYSNSKGEVSTKAIAISSSFSNNLHTLQFQSEFADAKLVGDFKISELNKLPSKLLSKYINVGKFRNTDSLRNETGNLTINFKNTAPILGLLKSGYYISENAELVAKYNLKAEEKIQLSFNAEDLKLANYTLHNVKLRTSGTDRLSTELDIARFNFTDEYSLIHLAVENDIQDNRMRTFIDFGNKKTLNYAGQISAISIFQERENQQFSVKNTLEPTKIYLNNQTWQISEAEILVDSASVAFDKLNISNGKSYVKADGVWSGNQKDAINISFLDFNIQNIWEILKPSDFDLSGTLSGYAKFSQKEDAYTLESDLIIPNLSVEKQYLGKLTVSSNWSERNDAIHSKASLSRNKTPIFSIDGNYEIEDGSLDYTLNLKKFKMNLLEGFVKDYITKLNGTSDGEVQIQGTLTQPVVNGSINFDIPAITLAETGVTYHLKETVNVENSGIIFDDFKISDATNHSAIVNGEVLLSMEKNSNINLNISAKKLRILQNSYQPLAYGNARATADLKVGGDFKNIKVMGSVTTDNNSKIIVPFDAASDIGDNDFITFINPADSTKYYERNGILFIPTGSTTPLTFDVDFKLNPTSEVQVLFESNSGSVLKTRGNADLFISRNQFEKQTIIGDYTIERGSFYYSLENIVSKKFIIEKGGIVHWNGAPEKAYVDLRAVYKTKASVLPLVYQESDAGTQGQTTVLCKAHITGSIDNPTLDFEIEFPNLENTIKGNVEASLQTTDITKQVLSLLIFNQFTTPDYIPNIAGSQGSALTTTTSQLLSSQVSNILSKLSDNVNIGFTYRPGDDLTKEELGLAVSTELLKNRVVISGNFGLASQNENSRLNDFIGDVNLYYYENKRNIKGVGFIFNEEFDTFKELIQHYKEKLGWKKKNSKK